MSTSIQFRSESFLYRGQRVPFLVYNGGDSPPEIAEARSGDLFSSGDTVWVKNEWGWEIGVADGMAKSRTRYPNFTDRILDRTDNGIYQWVASSTFRSRKHRTLHKNHKNTQLCNDGPLIPGLEPPGSQPTQPSGRSLLNNWLVALRERWTDVVVGSSCAAQGLSILDALLAFPNRIPLVSTFDPHHEIFIENQIPTLDRVISDLLDQTEFDRYDINRDVCGEAVRISKTELVTALSSAPRTTECALPLQPRSIISLSPRSNGIRVCNLWIPRDIGMHSIFEEDKDGPLWNSSLCLTGSLADVHLNCRGTTQLVVNVQCNQLWLFWPATAHNLAWWNTLYAQSSHKIGTVDAIREMHGLEVLYARGSQGFILPPYHFHAVVTFDTSIHANILLWGFQWLEPFQRGFKWVIDFATNYRHYNISSEEAESMLNSTQKDLNRWREVAEIIPEQPQADTLRVWLVSAAEDVRNALEILHT